MFNLIIPCKNFQQNFLQKTHGVPERERVLQAYACKKYLIRIKISLKTSMYIKNKTQLFERGPGELFHG